MVHWIKSNAFLMMGIIFIISAVVFQFLITFFNVNILLVGTFALAMAFAANDLVNFIGVPLAGLGAYKTAIASVSPLSIPMTALSKKVQSQTFLLLLAGGIMVITLWLSKKAKTVSETEIHLGQQDEGTEKFESVWLSRRIVNMAASFFSFGKLFIPNPVKQFVSKRISRDNSETDLTPDDKPSFDLLRASVNLMVASAVVSLATSLKLPLSTTYVTFMVAMGTSFSDQAWGRESAVYRVTGVLTVIGGWFMTAFIAFVVSFTFAFILYYFNIVGFAVIVCTAGFVIVRNLSTHKKRAEEKEEVNVFTLKHVDNFQNAATDTFDHLAYLLNGIRQSMDAASEALFSEDIDVLRKERKKVKQFQLWSNIIMANIFKVLRLLQKEDKQRSFNFYQIIRRLQKLSDGHRDVVIRSKMHVENRHTPLLESQVNELKELKQAFNKILSQVEKCFQDKRIEAYDSIVDQYKSMKQQVSTFNENQIDRIREQHIKTRKSILFFAISGNYLMMVKQNIKLLEILNESVSTEYSQTQYFDDLDSY